jgi:hypothetical protein
MDPQ